MPFDDARPAWVQTTEANLHLLCQFHHNLKTWGGWRVRRDPRTGATHWTSPRGRRYVRDPEPFDHPGEVERLRAHARDILAGMDPEAAARAQKPSTLVPGVLSRELDEWASIRAVIPLLPRACVEPPDTGGVLPEIQERCRDPFPAEPTF
ncbi:hypothetical protein EXU48_11080 [Occultella glacieicola]|uniref:HNH endonuclease n=1 Tax=Occultella glacieicola TaxID=2518684 RepID=A0ABY2E574_9MICO|nr:hypothetical protein [Occultella glacieicola]TDE93997.1 hypothetical protein EXU48_11080 [Occultella glacieicola]